MHLYMKHDTSNMTKFWDINGGKNIMARWTCYLHTVNICSCSETNKCVKSQRRLHGKEGFKVGKLIASNHRVNL
jgi:hypothetical protein